MDTLKIFLGAAPGVGKTYEMLVSGRARLSAGDDVVAGIVETHGRAETEALLSGLEIIPRKSIEYKGRVLDEMDLDALLTRRQIARREVILKRPLGFLRDIDLALAKPLHQLVRRKVDDLISSGERVLVCISEDPHSAGLVRYTKRVADRLRAPNRPGSAVAQIQHVLDHLALCRVDEPRLFPLDEHADNILVGNVTLEAGPQAQETENRNRGQV